MYNWWMDRGVVVEVDGCSWQSYSPLYPPYSMIIYTKTSPCADEYEYNPTMQSGSELASLGKGRDVYAHCRVRVESARHSLAAVVLLRPLRVGQISTDNRVLLSYGCPTIHNISGEHTHDSTMLFVLSQPWTVLMSSCTAHRVRNAPLIDDTLLCGPHANTVNTRTQNSLAIIAVENLMVPTDIFPYVYFSDGNITIFCFLSSFFFSDAIRVAYNFF